jgi:hypothetical protein
MLDTRAYRRPAVVGGVVEDSWCWQHKSEMLTVLSNVRFQG